jgi:hypothetical protein
MPDIFLLVAKSSSNRYQKNKRLVIGVTTAKNRSKNQSLVTRSINDHEIFLFFMSITYVMRSRAAKLGWIRRDLDSLKRSYASFKG